MKKLFLLLPLFVLLSFCSSESGKDKGSVEIEFVDSLGGNFSFANEWSYPDGVYRNQFGQLSCDGFCPPETDVMLDVTGRILEDSLAAFYSLVDTTHRFHTIDCEAACYEWAGTDYAEAKQRSADTVYCSTACNPATHCSLQIYLVKGICIPTIKLLGITKPGSRTYHCRGGYVKIDSALLKTNRLKAEFNFTFDDKENPSKSMFWRGRMFTTVK